jgi:serine-type D-Ala-D-Ala carboxypeptidase (penicillin-binding protein 5/6)
LRPFAAIRALFICLAFSAFCAAPAAAQPFDTKAPNAILVDYETGTVLFEKAADEPFEPASMTKLMTADLIFDALKSGKLKESDAFNVSEHAWRTGGAPAGGSAMYAEIHSDIPVQDLLRGLIVQSGNDAAIVLAEGLAGSEQAFVDRMNERAAALGMTGTHFANPNGLFDPDQKMTARDLATLARTVIHDFPEYYPIFSEPEFTWNKIRQLNKNPLVGDNIGVDGLKTGYIKESGYDVTASALRDGQRLILVVAGLSSESDREAEAKRILDWGFRSFQKITAYEKDEIVTEASVYGGEIGHVPLKAGSAVTFLAPRDGKERLKASVVYQGPLMAPVKEGIEVGALKVWSGDRLIQETPLFTAGSVQRGPLHARALDALGELLFGWLP